MITSTKKESAFAGFLNGYVAGNLSANSKELQFHKDKITSFLNELHKEIIGWGEDTDKLQFEEIYNKIYNLPFTNSVEYYFILGDKLLNIYDLIELKFTTSDIPTTTSFILKKIIYHYLNIATTLKTNKITKMAKEIVAKFESK